MSLLWHGRELQRAVLGELSPVAEARLARHLRGCAACRARYDQLAQAKALLDEGRTARARAGARLVAALEGRGADPGERAPDRRRRWLLAPLALAPAAALLLWITRPAAPPPERADEVTLRGVADAGAALDLPTLVLYASRKGGPGGHGPVRLVAELPGSGEARVSALDYLQLGVRRLRAPAHVRVVGIDERGAAHDYLPDTVAAAGPSVLGRSVDLGRDHAAGRVRIVAVFSAEPIDNRAMQAAVAGGGGGGGVITGTLVIEP